MNVYRSLLIVVIAIIVVMLFLFVKPIIVISNIKVETTTSATGIFFDVKNYSPRKICLYKAEIKELPQTKVMIHKTVEIETGVYKMQMVEKACIPAFSTLSLTHGPGGYHLMIGGTPQLQGKTLVLYFDDGSVIEKKLP